MKNKFLLLIIAILVAVTAIAVYKSGLYTIKKLDNTALTETKSRGKQKKVEEKSMLEEISDVSIQKNANGFTASFPVGTCADVTGTPIYVDPYVLFTLHEKTGKDCLPTGRLRDSIIAFDTRQQKFYAIEGIGNSEPAVSYNNQTGMIFTSILEKGAFALINSADFSVVDLKPEIAASSDSSAAAFGDYFFFGTINHPVTCQRPVNKDCGALFKINTNGGVERSINYLNSLRGWITGAPTTDGTGLYIGTGAANFGEKESDDLNGCSVVKLDKNLNILASVDIGDPGCARIGKLESAIVGEVAIGKDRVWAQTNGPSDDRPVSAVIQFDSDLNEICRAEFPAFTEQTSASFYQSPVIDSKGNAYVSVKLLNSPPIMALYKIEKQNCGKTLITKRFAIFGAAPTLADDKYALFAAAGSLTIHDIETGQLIGEYDLPDKENSIAAPIIVDGIIYLVTKEGTFTAIENSGLADYGSALWPRVRHDNAGSGNSSQ